MDLSAEQLAAVKELEAGQLQPPARRLLHQVAQGFLYTKLRPFVFEMLEGLKELFELHIYTMGDKLYAREIAAILDPDKRLFGGRVISQNDSTNAFAKDLDVVLSSERHVLILDDTQHVWQRHRDNLIQVCSIRLIQ